MPSTAMVLQAQNINPAELVKPKHWLSGKLPWCPSMSGDLGPAGLNNSHKLSTGLSTEGWSAITDKDATAGVNQYKHPKAMEVSPELRLSSANQLYLLLIHHEGQSIPRGLTLEGDITARDMLIHGCCNLIPASIITYLRFTKHHEDRKCYIHSVSLSVLSSFWATASVSDATAQTCT